MEDRFHDSELDGVVMQIRDFNTLDTEAAQGTVRPCLGVERWVNEVVDARPYASARELHAKASQSAASLSASEIDDALAHHPRIGERATGASAEAELSRGEQASLSVDEEVAARLASGNRAYEDRFDRVFLIRAKGRTSAEILAELERRLSNDDAAEVAEVAEQLRQIALVRLEGIVPLEGTQS